MSRQSTRLENDRHEQFARCLGMQNKLEACAVGVGYDVEVARALARQKQIKDRAKVWYDKKRRKDTKFKYPV